MSQFCHASFIKGCSGGIIIIITLIVMASQRLQGDSDDTHLAVEMRRYANDGIAYTYNEFVQHYGNKIGPKKWDEAKTAFASPSPSAAINTLPTPPTGEEISTTRDDSYLAAAPPSNMTRETSASIHPSAAPLSNMTRETRASNSVDTHHAAPIQTNWVHPEREELRREIAELRREIAELRREIAERNAKNAVHRFIDVKQQQQKQHPADASKC